MQYVSWASIQKYASEIVVVNEFHQLNLTCEEQLQGEFSVSQIPGNRHKIYFETSNNFFFCYQVCESK